MAVGKVRWFSGPLGYGFIERDDGKSFFVHYTALHEHDPQPIRTGEQVEFEIHEGLQGPQATHVNRVVGAPSAF
jgi:CspA family cold shock protein